MEIKDYFKILGVDRKADLKEIKKAYRKLALKYHPDMNAEAGAEDKFKEVAEAYEVLKSPEKRAEYEALLQHGTTQSGDFPPGWQSGARHTRDFQSEAEFSDFFNQFFGGGRQRPHPGSAEPDLFKGQDIEIEVPIFLEDTLTTNQKDLQYNVPVIEGQYIHQQKKKLKVRIPEGVKDGERIRVKGQGAPGSEHRLNGDLFLHIRLVPHPLFDVQGHDLILKVPVTPWEAALGCKINIPTLKGKVNLAIPPNSQNGAKLRLKGQGLKSRDGAGDLFAIVNIAMPADNPKSSQQFWQGLAENIPFEPRAEWSV